MKTTLSTRSLLLATILTTAALSASDAAPAHADGSTKLADAVKRGGDQPYRRSTNRVVYARDDTPRRRSGPASTQPDRRRSAFRRPILARDDSFAYSRDIEQAHRRSEAADDQGKAELHFQRRNYDADDKFDNDDTLRPPSSTRSKDRNGKGRGAAGTSDPFEKNKGDPSFGNDAQSASHPAPRKKKKPLSMDQDTMYDKGASAPNDPQQASAKSAISGPDPTSQADQFGGVSGQGGPSSQGLGGDPSMLGNSQTGDAGATASGDTGFGTSLAGPAPAMTPALSPAPASDSNSSVQLPPNVKPSSPGFLFLPVAGPPSTSSASANAVPSSNQPAPQPIRQTLFFNIEAPAGGQMTRVDVPPATAPLATSTSGLGSTDPTMQPSMPSLDDIGNSTASDLLPDSGKKKGGCNKDKDKDKSSSDDSASSATIPPAGGVDRFASTMPAYGGAASSSSSSAAAAQGGSMAPGAANTHAQRDYEQLQQADKYQSSYTPPSMPSDIAGRPSEFKSPASDDQLSATGATHPHADDKYPHLDGDLKPSPHYARSLKATGDEDAIQRRAPSPDFDNDDYGPDDDGSDWRGSGDDDLYGRPSRDDVIILGWRDGRDGRSRPLRRPPRRTNSNNRILQGGWHEYGDVDDGNDDGDGGDNDGIDRRDAMLDEWQDHRRSIDQQPVAVRRSHPRMWPDVYSHSAISDDKKHAQQRQDWHLREAKGKDARDNGKPLWKRLTQAGHRDRTPSYWHGEKLQ